MLGRCEVLIDSNHTLASYFHSVGLICKVFKCKPHGCRKQAEIKEALQHSWKGYTDYAWGMDELTPLTKAGAAFPRHPCTCTEHLLHLIIPITSASVNAFSSVVDGPSLSTQHG